MPRIIVEVDGATDREISLEPGTFTIGTAADRDVVVPESRFVSAEHAAVHFESGTWLVRDGGSAHGTYVNDRRVKEQRLQEDDVLQLGLGGPTVRFGAPREEEGAGRSGAITAGRRKPFFGRFAEGSRSEPRGGATSRSSSIGRRGVLYGLGALALLALAALWMADRDGDVGADPGRLAAASSPIAPGGVLHPLREASRAYADEAEEMASEIEAYREGGDRRARLQRTLAGIAAGIAERSDDPAALDSLRAERVSVEDDLAVLERLRTVGRDAAGSVVLIQTGFQVDSFYFPGPTGTGVFVGEGGRLVTSRRLVAPDSYIRSSDEAGLACALGDLEENGRTATRIVSVWTDGSTPQLRRDGTLDPATATHSTLDGTVEVLGSANAEGANAEGANAEGAGAEGAFAEGAGAEEGEEAGAEEMEPRMIECPGGGVVASGHDPDREADLALLSIPGEDFPTVLLADVEPAPGDMVVLTGFLRGAVGGAGSPGPWMGFGAVTSDGEPMRFDVPVLPGTHGGPLLDGEGRLVGVATGSQDGEGVAVGASHVRALLDGF